MARLAGHVARLVHDDRLDLGPAEVDAPSKRHDSSVPGRCLVTRRKRASRAAF
jgi:hypothetical protein